jgi:hypothetical protein
MFLWDCFADRAFVIASRNDTTKRKVMTVPQTLAVVLNPASGLELTSVIISVGAIKCRPMRDYC